MLRMEIGPVDLCLWRHSNRDLGAKMMRGHRAAGEKPPALVGSGLLTFAPLLRYTVMQTRRPTKRLFRDDMEERNRADDPPPTSAATQRACLAFCNP